MQKSCSPSQLAASISLWITKSEKNKLAHILNGNKNQRGTGIKYLYWNKGSSFLFNKMEEISSIIQTHKPHIFGLGEANFHHDHNIEEMKIPGYNLHIDSCVNNPNLGVARVVVYTHEILRFKRRDDLEDETSAAIWFECGLPQQKSFLVCAAYRQWRLLNQCDGRSALVSAQLKRWDKFLDKWELALQEDKEVIVAMDANLDHLTWRMQDSLPPHNSSVRLKPLIDSLFKRIIPYGVTQLVTCATRVQRGQPRTGLDHLYSNRIEKLSSIQTFLMGTSDHKLIKVVRFSKDFKHLPRFVKKRSFKDFDPETFKTFVRDCGLEDILQIKDVEIAAEMFTDKLSKVLDRVAPVRRFQTRSNYAPWMTKDTKNLKEKREVAHKKAIHTDHPDDWRLFRSIRNQVTAKLKKDKREWETKRLNFDEHDPAKIWNSVKGWLGWNTGGTPKQLFWQGKMISSPSGLALAMNTFFLEKIEKLRNNIPTVAGNPIQKLEDAMKKRSCRFTIKSVTEEEVIMAIRNLKNSNATGVDYIDIRTIKLIADIVAPVFTHIVNLSIRFSVFPEVYKWAKVVPLLKSSTADTTLPKSYRPVALLPVLSKVLEKVVFSQLVKYLEENKLIHPNLHGSRVNHDTSTALIQLYDKWVQEIEEGRVVGVLFCDQSAAFDLCDHGLLLKKFKLMGVEDNAWEWIKSYLSNRKQSCFIDGELSPPRNVIDCSVPQGSIFGPLLWLIFT